MRLVAVAVVIAVSAAANVFTSRGAAAAPSLDTVTQQPLAFVRIADDGCCRYVPPTMYTVRTDGTRLRRVTKPDEGLWDAHPSWSPDGTAIAFARVTRRDGGGYWQEESIFVMSADGSDRRRLTRGGIDRNPNWSRDGRKLIFSRDGDLWTVSARGSWPRPFGTSFSGLEAVPSPDGRWLAVVRLSPPQVVPRDLVLVLMRPDGSHRRFLAAANRGRVSWSPDSRKIAFTRREGIAVIGRDGTGLRHLADGEDPAWSPDGDQIVFSAYRGGERSGLFVIDADGSSLRRLFQPSPEVIEVSPSYRRSAR